MASTTAPEIWPAHIPDGLGYRPKWQIALELARAAIDDQWLVIERSTNNEPATHHVLTTLPKTLTRKELVRRIKQRCRIERTYEDIKGELGLDHFEGRSYRGWHHHVSTVLACYAFVVSERAQGFPPKARRTQRDDSLAIAA